VTYSVLANFFLHFAYARNNFGTQLLSLSELYAEIPFNCKETYRKNLTHKLKNIYDIFSGGSLTPEERLEIDITI
jgi:hypothetical protein